MCRIEAESLLGSQMSPGPQWQRVNCRSLIFLTSPIHQHTGINYNAHMFGLIQEATIEPLTWAVQCSYITARPGHGAIGWRATRHASHVAASVAMQMTINCRFLDFVGSVSPWHIFRLKVLRCAPDGSRVSQMMGVVALSGSPCGFMMNQNLQIFH